MNPDHKGNLLVKVFVLLIGLFFTFAPAYKIGLFLLHKSQSVETFGVVVKLGKGQYMGCKPFIEFYDNSNSRIEIRSDINHYVVFCPEMGDQIRLLYEKSNPENALIVSPLHNYFIPGCFLLIGLFFLCSVLTGRVEK